MVKMIRKLLLGLVVILASQACAPPGPPTLDPNVINTAIARTMAAALTQTAQPGIPITGLESPTPTATIASSPTPLPSFTPVVITVPQISVSVATNCRVGPGTAYARVGALLVGESAEVVGRSADRNYWVIRNPDRAGQLCWLWGEHATLTGVPDLLPVHTPPPTPTATQTTTPLPTATRTRTPASTSTSTPGFTASYSNLESCTGTGWWVDIQLQNNGGIAFESIALILSDITAGSVIPLYADNFTDRNGCSETNTWDTLPTGGTRLVSSPVFSYDPTGHELRATITLCSNAGQSGTCVTQTISFTP